MLYYHPCLLAAEISLDEAGDLVLPCFQSKPRNYFHISFVSWHIRQGRRCPTDAFIFQSARERFQYTPAGGEVFYGQTAAVCPCQCEGYRHGNCSRISAVHFPAFWRSDRARSRRVEGSDWDDRPSHCSRAGKITVSSQVGVGSCFAVLPMV